MLWGDTNSGRWDEGVEPITIPTEEAEVGWGVLGSPSTWALCAFGRPAAVMLAIEKAFATASAAATLPVEPTMTVCIALAAVCH